MDHPPIVIVEDSDEDFDIVQLLLVSIGVENPLWRCATSAEAIEMFHRLGRRDPSGPAEPLPALMLLDLNLPGIDGRDLLQRFRHDDRLRIVPVVILSTSANPRDIRFCYDAGANAYMVKPVDLDRLERMLRALVDFWLHAAVLPAAVEDAA